MNGKLARLKKIIAGTPESLTLCLVLAVVALCLAIWFYFWTPPLEQNSVVKRVDKLISLQKKGRQLIVQRQYPEAIVILNQALLIDPDSEDTLMDRAVANYQLHDYDAAMADYQVVMDLAKKSASTKKDDGKAAGQSDFSRALYGVALCQLGLDRKELAVKSLHQLQSIDDHFILTYELLGDLYLKANDSEEALDAYTCGLRVNPQSAVLHYDRAMAYLRRSMKAEAFEDLSAALKTQPQSLTFLLQHANLAQKLNKLAIADTDAAEILRLQADNKSALKWLKKRGLPVPQRAAQSEKD